MSDERVLVTMVTGQVVRAVRTTEHPASSYGQPVLVADDGDVIDTLWVLNVQPDPGVEEIEVHLNVADLLSDDEGVNVEASAGALASLIERTLSNEYPGATVTVLLHRATGVKPPTRVNGDTGHEAHWDVDQVVQNCWASFDEWVVPGNL